MWIVPRRRLDLAPGDLAAALGSCLCAGDWRGLAEAVERLWDPRGRALACLSVRSALDLLLAAWAWPRGSEVLVSALNVGDVARILAAHGLVAVPLDLDPRDVAPDPGQARALCTARTRGLLVAHLFGGRVELEPLAALARERDLVLVEDCAQAFVGPRFRGHEAARASLFSFGLIKSATALGGGLLTVRDEALLARVRALRDAQPLQARREYLARTLKGCALWALACRLPYTLLVRASSLLGYDHDRLLDAASRGFPGPDLLGRIRRRPSVGLLRVLLRRLRRADDTLYARRAALAERVRVGLPGGITLWGGEAPHHGHWVLPLLVSDPDALVAHLRARGLDATRGTSAMRVLEPPPGRPPAARAAEGLRRLCYAPFDERTDERGVDALLAALAAFGAAGPRGAAAAGGLGRSGGPA